MGVRATGCRSNVWIGATTGCSVEIPRIIGWLGATQSADPRAAAGVSINADNDSGGADGGAGPAAGGATGDGFGMGASPPGSAPITNDDRSEVPTVILATNERR